MTYKFLVKVALIGVLSPLAGCSLISKTIPSAAASADKAIVLTDVDFDPASLIPETQPVADYLGSHLDNVGIGKGEVQIAPDSETVAKWIADGKTDLYFDSVYPIMKVMERTKGTPILRRWKHGVGEYSTYFVVRRNSGLNKVSDLQGKMIAFESPDSSSTFMFPMVYMLKANLKPVEKAEANHPVQNNEIGYVFAGDTDTIKEWIMNGKVAAGAIDSESFTEIPEADRKQLAVIAETDRFPRHVVLAGPDLTPEQIQSVKTVLLNMNQSDEGKAALKEFGKTTQFDELPAGSLSRLQDAYTLLQKYLKEHPPEP